MTIRRDAATMLPNGRVRYDALFSRVGIQTYGASVEYRPASEVFAERSRASGSNAPGVLLHPSDNFGTSFASGSYPVRGTTGDKIEQHADGIHTSGTLIVWDDEWNTLIEADEIVELSVGYTIDPDETPGVAPDGTAYQVVHRNIVWDHVAGVPEGNAGSARVLADAKRTTPAATRRALADIAAARMDARPLYFDLGQWPAPREEKTPTMDKKAIAKAIADAIAKLRTAAKLDAKAPTTPKIMHDALVSVIGEVDDPILMAALEALGAMPAAPAEGEPAPAPEGEPAAPPAEGQPVADAAKKPATAAPVFDAAAMERRVLDAADARADVLTLARDVFGREYSPRSDAGAALSTETIKLAIIGKIDPSRLDKIKRFDAKAEATRRADAIDHHLDECRAIHADRMDYGEQLLNEIHKTREHVRNDANVNEAVAKLQAEIRKRKLDAATQVHGHAQAPAGS